MRRDFITISRGESLLEALQLMRLARLRHLTIESDGVLVGILSYRDLQDELLRALDPGRRLEAMPARGAPQRSSTCGLSLLDRPRRDARRGRGPARATPRGLSAGRRVGEQGLRVVGLLTEMDLLRAAYGTS